MMNRRPYATSAGGTPGTVPASTPAIAMAPASRSALAAEREDDECRQGGHRDQHSLTLLRADPRDQRHAERERAHDGAKRVGRVDPAREPPRIVARLRRGGQREREAGSPQHRRREDRPDDARQIDLEREPWRAG